jgi:branched-chain amino acid transport system permease protein
MSDGRRAGTLAPARTAWSRPAALKWPEPPGISRPRAPSLPRGRFAEAMSLIRARHVIVLAALIAYPFLVPPFWTFQIGGQTLTLGLIALSLAFLAGYGGIVSIAQMTVAGIAGYVYAMLGTSATTNISLGWPWWVAALLAVPTATLAATLIGWLAVRTEGIYTIMITLAAGMAVYYLVHQNYTLFNGFTGFQAVLAPEAFGVKWRDPLPFYFLSLACALGGYALVKYIGGAPFGIALQGIRDNPRRMAALGFNVRMYRIAAYTLAGLLAAIGGLLLVWYNALITPGVVDTKSMINILIIAVLGGFAHPLGPFIGAAIFVLLQNFAIDVVDRLSGGIGLRDRFNLVIGGVFLLIVLFSPDGLLGLWTRLRRWLETAKERSDPRAGR